MKPYGAKKRLRRSHWNAPPKKLHGRDCILCHPSQKPRVGSKKTARRSVVEEEVMLFEGEKEYQDCFPTLGEAVDFEVTALGVAREFLPTCAIDVLEGKCPTPEYWEWLTDQYERSQGSTLHNYETGEALRPATSEERADSISASSRDGGAGVIVVEGCNCYVVD